MKQVIMDISAGIVLSGFIVVMTIWMMVLGV